MLEQRDLDLIAEVVEKAIEPTNRKLDNLEVKVSNVDTRLQNVETKVGEIDTRLQNVETKVEEIDTRLQNVETKVEEIDNRLCTVETQVQQVDEKVEKVALQVRDVQLTIENEINPKISIIAEGHSILNRKLDKGLAAISDVADDRERFQLKLVYLESELIKIKERIFEPHKQTEIAKA